jgi:hypothetical protein
MLVRAALHHLACINQPVTSTNATAPQTTLNFFSKLKGTAFERATNAVFLRFRRLRGCESASARGESSAARGVGYFLKPAFGRFYLAKDCRSAAPRVGLLQQVRQLTHAPPSRLKLIN